MTNLIKIKEISNKYDVTTRTLRYYEDAGLLSSTRSDDYAYRMYDESAIVRLEQILILRKLNIGIKDIKRIFADSGSAAVLEVLRTKAQSIDNDMALMHELKDIVLDFIAAIETMNFANNSDVKLLYDKAGEIKTQFATVDYIGKPNQSKVERFVEITDALDHQIPEVTVVRIPPFKAVTSAGHDNWFDLMGWAWDEARPQDMFKNIIFDCKDFLLRHDADDGSEMEYIIALQDGVSETETAPFIIINFPGGLYAMSTSIADDHESIHKVEAKVMRWLDTTNFVFDETRCVMGNMAYTDDEVKRGLGYEQLQRCVPIKVKADTISLDDMPVDAAFDEFAKRLTDEQHGLATMLFNKIRSKLDVSVKYTKTRATFNLPDKEFILRLDIERNALRDGIPFQVRLPLPNCNSYMNVIDSMPDYIKECFRCSDCKNCTKDCAAKMDYTFEGNRYYQCHFITIGLYHEGNIDEITKMLFAEHNLSMI